jgi:hypothetical protein
MLSRIIWPIQIDVHSEMVAVWIAYAQGKEEEALQMLRMATDREDAMERDRNVPGAIISARALAWRHAAGKLPAPASPTGIRALISSRNQAALGASMALPRLPSGAASAT